MLEGMRAPRLASLGAAVLATACVAACGGDDASGSPAAAKPTATATRSGGHDWTRFGYDAARTSRAPRGIAASKVKGLSEHRVSVDGTVDSSPIYVRNVKGRDLVIVTTTYGKTLALNPVTG